MFRRLAQLILFLLIANKIVQSQDSEGWIPVTRDENIDWDLESVPVAVEIKTDSTLGSDEGVVLGFKNAQNGISGIMSIKFSSRPQYNIALCGRHNFPTTLPSTSYKIWRITLDKSDGIRLIIHCNGVEVANVQLTYQTCGNYHRDWRYLWSRDVTKIFFTPYDTASDYYRPYTGWIPVTRGEYIDWDLESVPIEIKTDSRLGRYEQVRLFFFTAQDDYAGGVYIRYLSTPQCYFLYCSDWINIQTTRPSATEKIWRITLDRSEGIRLIIRCNGVEVLNILLSDQVCTKYGSNYLKYWSRDVSQLYFSSTDTASDYYRPYTGEADGWASGESRYTFHTIETTKSIGDKHQLYVTTINGTIKGPAIHVNNGSKLWVNVINGLTDGGLGLSIHWHGLNMRDAQKFDGVVGLTQCPIALNDSFLYNWPINEQPGTYWYHTHDRKMLTDNFIKGPLIVHESNAPIPRTMHDSYRWDNEIIIFYVTIDESISLGFVNGEEHPLIQVENVEYRFRIINGGGHHLFFSIGSYKLTVVAADGYSVEPYETDGIQIGIAERYDVKINFSISTETKTEDVCIRAQFAEKMEKGLFATLRIRKDGSVPSNETKPDINQVCSGVPPITDKKILNCYNDTFECTQVTALTSTLTRNLYNSSFEYHTVKIMVHPISQEPHVEWKVAINHMNFKKNVIPCRPAIKSLGKRAQKYINRSANILNLPKDASVTIVLLSNTMEKHPMHSHGHHYEVLEIYAPTNATEGCPFPYVNTAFSEPIEQLKERPKQGVLKDTVLLPPCGAVAVRLNSDNQGVWFFHCHIDFHLHNGLAWILNEDKYMFSQTQFPSDYPSCQVCGRQ